MLPTVYKHHREPVWVMFTGKCVGTVVKSSNPGLPVGLFRKDWNPYDRVYKDKPVWIEEADEEE